MPQTDYSKKEIIARVAVLEGDTPANSVQKPEHPSALVTALTTVTATAPSSADYALQDLTDTGGFGFKTKNEGNSLIAVVINLQARLAALEAIVVTAGLATAAV